MRPVTPEPAQALLGEALLTHPEHRCLQLGPDEHRALFNAVGEASGASPIIGLIVADAEAGDEHRLPPLEVDSLQAATERQARGARFGGAETLGDGQPCVDTLAVAGRPIAIVAQPVEIRRGSEGPRVPSSAGIWLNEHGVIAGASHLNQRRHRWR